MNSLLESQPPGVTKAELRGVWAACLHAAVQAPSPDNTQPWRFQLQDDALRIRLEPSRMRRFLDAGGAFALFSLGAALENVVQTANALGHAVDADVRRAATEGVQLRLGPPASAAASGLQPAIERRHTARGALQPLPDPALLDDLAQGVSPGFELSWVHERGPLAALASVLEGFDKLRFGNRTCHAEMHETLRFGSADDGLPAATLGITALQAALLRGLRPWPVMRPLKALGAAHAMARASKRSLLQCAGIGMLSQRHGGDWLEAGRAFQRLWLGMVRAGVALQPWAFPVMLASTSDWAQGPVFSECERAHAWRLVSELRAVLGGPSDGHRLVMLFRYGVCAGPVRAVAPRRALARFMEPRA